MNEAKITMQPHTVADTCTHTHMSARDSRKPKETDEKPDEATANNRGTDEQFKRQRLP